jgi:2-keto-4-pentenoate hydratase/2-oxohepta-3-ene-1,7-dioic acid hydratase in catechol pathway
MRLVIFEKAGSPALGIRDGDSVIDVAASGLDAPADVSEVLRAGEPLLQKLRALAETASSRLPLEGLRLLPPSVTAGKIICLGLNYISHANEVGIQQKPDYPTVFFRANTSLVGPNDPIIKPRISDAVDYEGELVAFIGKGGRHIPEADALDHVAGYAVFNDVSIRDYQMRTIQWTVGKNFDGSGPFGPEFVSADELPAGASGLKIQTRLNGEIMQNATTSDMIFGVAETIGLLSQCFTLEAGDILVMGTPSGVGNARDPKVFMKQGDVCEVEIERIGVVRNPIVNEA